MALGARNHHATVLSRRIHRTIPLGAYKKTHLFIDPSPNRYAPSIRGTDKIKSGVNLKYILNGLYFLSDR